jgi:hypothetical protein
VAIVIVCDLRAQRRAPAANAFAGRAVLAPAYEIVRGEEHGDGRLDESSGVRDSRTVATIWFGA